MQTIYSTILLLLLGQVGFKASAQTIYFDQDFSGPGPFENPNPGAGQFNMIHSTRPDKSFHQFEGGFMHLIRLLKDTTSGGIVRVVRSSPLSPTPETLYIQIRLSVAEVTAQRSNEVYFYVGERFSLTKNSIPDNNLLFSKFAINFEDNSFYLRDISAGRNSPSIPLGTFVTITWVLNNSDAGQIYKLSEAAPEADYIVQPGRYDLWIDNNLMIGNAAGYPGSTVKYDVASLSNFEIRFRDGSGKVTIDKILVRDISGILPIHISEFQAKQENNKVRLFWQAKLEGETEKYIVQRSKDLDLFSTIGEINAYGTASSDYVFMDDKTEDGISYYRIGQVHKDGSVEYSSYRDVVCRKTSLPLSVVPNPASGHVIHLNSGHVDVNSLRLTNINGLEIPFRPVLFAGGKLDIHPLQKLCNGIYMVSMNGNGARQYARVFVDH